MGGRNPSGAGTEPETQTRSEATRTAQSTEMLASLSWDCTSLTSAPRLSEIADSAATETAVTASTPHRRAPRPRPITPRIAGIPIAISAVTVPRSLPHDTERATNEAREHCLDWSAFENEGKQPGKSGCRDSRNRVFGGCCAPVVREGRNKCGVCIHVSIVALSGVRDYR